jgi:F-box protein 18 (helicase)
LIQMHYLQSGQKEKLTKYKNFKSFAALKAFAQNTGDTNILGKIFTVEMFSDKLPKYVEKLYKFCSPSLKKIGQTDYVFSTIHKSKGMEWDTVVLLDDLLPEDNDWTGR